MSNKINVLLQARIIKHFTYYHFNTMNLSPESYIFIGKEKRHRRHSGLLEHPIDDLKASPSIGNEKVKRVSLRRRSFDCAQKILTKNSESNEHRWKSWESKRAQYKDKNDDTVKITKRRDIFERKIDFNTASLDDNYFPVTSDVDISSRQSKTKSLKHWMQNSVSSEKTKIQVDASRNTTKKYNKNEIKMTPKLTNTQHYFKDLNTVDVDVTSKKRRSKKRRSYGMPRKNDNFNTTFLEEAEDENNLQEQLKANNLNILENIDITNFDSPSFIEKAINKRRYHKKEPDDFNKIREYYLNKVVKPRSSNLETIFEVPKKDNFMTFRKYKRFINFDDFNNKARVKRRQFKAIKINPTLLKMDNFKEEKLESLLEKLSDIDVY